ncbi:hypothetical protein ACP70R_001787 [Stipagrostis hirtigluma subsp. patula]
MEDMVSSRDWPNLPSDLLRDVSSRLHAAADYVRFHAVCRPWRDTLPPAPARPAFLPWLLAPCDGTGHRRARCVFSSSKSRRRRRATAVATRIRDRRWVISTDDGVATWPQTGSPDSRGLVDPLAGSAATLLPRYPDEVEPWAEHATTLVSGDGTIFLYSFGHHAAFLRPGETEWTVVGRCPYVSAGYRDRSSVVHRDGRIVVCVGDSSRCIVRTPSVNLYYEWSRMPGEPDKVLRSSYVLESRGELLWAFVQVRSAYYWYNDVLGYGVGGGRKRKRKAEAMAMSVSVYGLQEVEGGSVLRWVRRDRRSLADRILFLGRPSSFAVDAARFGMSGGGCAYFVHRRRMRRRVYKYSFRHKRSQLVEKLPADWDDEEACMWVTPKPDIAPTQLRSEKGLRLQGTSKS